MGMMDGHDNDHYLHPFNNVDGGNSASMGLNLFKSNGAGKAESTVVSMSCSCVHLHRDYDTSPNAECLYRSGHTVPNWHYHAHHGGYCG